jgi:hypothetical protein
MSRKRPDPVGSALEAIERAYEPLSPDQRRELDNRLLDADWFGHEIKIKMFLSVARAETEAAKNSRRSRPPSKQIQARNDAWLADHEGSAGKQGMSLEDLVDATGTPKSTIRAGLREAEARRAEALELKRWQEYVIECRKRAAAQAAKLPRGNNQGGCHEQ